MSDFLEQYSVPLVPPAALAFILAFLQFLAKAIPEHLSGYAIAITILGVINLVLRFWAAYELTGGGGPLPQNSPAMGGGSARRGFRLWI